ncbi:hypothetical protein [Neobacillus vireti]|uniref:Uncharacterized protein n=1 Tax=Neobacillus vireti LMG 21834 TaxID=1131730 RepID=A0AB94IM51_9BACI|nr:hypothetical protein [Neobacillus vireti]ETI68124.1 hypothetical protein BAVI_14014 [Neobacillus vireti LMG 21834]
MMKNINSFATLIEAIAYYTKFVAECSKSRDYSHHEDIMNFKRQLHVRIERERVTFND